MKPYPKDGISQNCHSQLSSAREPTNIEFPKVLALAFSIFPSSGMKGQSIFIAFSSNTRKSQQYLIFQAVLQQTALSLHQLQCFCLTKLKSIIICTAAIFYRFGSSNSEDCQLDKPLMGRLRYWAQLSAIDQIFLLLQLVLIKFR